MPSPRDPAAFAVLVETHERAVLAYALRRATTHADAEDAAAETWAIAWRRRDVLPDDPLPWLYATARRVLANQHRGGRRRLALLQRLRGRLDPTAIADPGGPSGPDPVVVEALARLRPDDAELLRLVAWEELEHARIAAILGVTANAVAIRLHRARARFAEVYREIERDAKGEPADRTHGPVKAPLARRAKESAE